MQAERWKQIEELYQAALAQPPEKRAEFLTQACPGDPQLRGEVQSLLDQQADSFLESAPLYVARTGTEILADIACGFFRARCGARVRQQKVIAGGVEWSVQQPSSR
jgi:hypothetical protein